MTRLRRRLSGPPGAAFARLSFGIALVLLLVWGAPARGEGVRFAPPDLRELFQVQPSAAAGEPSSWISQWLGAPGMLGDWGGLRPALGRLGIVPTLTFVTDVLGNPLGGRRQAVREFDDVALEVDVALEKLIGAPGTKFHVGASQRSGTSLSDIDIGNVFNVAEVCCGATVRLVDLYLEQPFWNDRLNIRAGRLSAGDEFMTSPLYWLFLNEGFDGNPFGIFLNAPGMTVYPTATWGLRARVRPAEQVYVMAGVFNGDPTLGDNGKHGVDWTLRGPLFAMAEVGYLHNQYRGASGLPGNYKIGAYYDGGTYPDFLRDVSGGLAPVTGLPSRLVRGKTGFYVLADQMVYREGSGPSAQGLTTFIAVVVASAPSVDAMPLFIDGGLIYRGLVPGRANDVAAFGVVYGRFSDDLGRAQRLMGQPAQDFELVLEWTYAIQLARWLKVQPDVQYVIKPGGTGAIPSSLVLGFQLGVTF